METCGSQYSIFTRPVNQAWDPGIRLVKLYDLLQPLLHAQSFHNYTNELLSNYGKNKYQILNLQLSAQESKYDAAIWMDSEAIAVQLLRSVPYSASSCCCLRCGSRDTADGGTGAI